MIMEDCKKIKLDFGLQQISENSQQVEINLFRCLEYDLSNLKIPYSVTTDHLIENGNEVEVSTLYFNSASHQRKFLEFLIKKNYYYDEDNKE